MMFKDIISNDYFKLFVKREGKVVLGRRCSNLWLLSGVLLATFLAIAFSNASLEYLDYKMNDPFINWVDIKNNFGEDDFIGFEEALKDADMQSKYHFEGYQTDKYRYTLYATASADSRNLKCRFFADIRTQLVAAILDKENVVDGCRIATEALDNESYGVIITQEALRNKLGYKDELPPYIYYRAYCDPEAADDLGADVVNGQFSDIPVPVLAVVKRLPTNMDVIGTKYFYLQDNARAFNMYEPSYFCSFIYFLPKKVDASSFLKFLEEVVVNNTDMSYYVEDDVVLPRMGNFAEGSFVSLKFDYEDEVDFTTNKQINETVMAKYGEKGVVRMFDYVEGSVVEDADDYISVYFSNLNEITKFQEVAKEQFKIDIEMSQINAKENFNEVSIMANILSWTMIVFAIVCIILFIVNLLQSYFQKVKRNLGTFKAFGISNRELISVYVFILVVIICASTLLAIIVTLFIQGLLPLLGIVKDDVYNYLDLFSGKTLGAVVIIMTSSIYTVYVVMKHLLKATPGDLIYDR